MHSIWIPVLATVVVLVYTVVVYVGNRGSFHNYIDPAADGWMYGSWVLAVLAWLIWWWLTR